jgi:hypothetical protein
LKGWQKSGIILEASWWSAEGSEEWYDYRSVLFLHNHLRQHEEKDVL